MHVRVIKSDNSFIKNNLIKESNIFKQTNLLINNKDLYCEINNDVCFHGILAYNFTYNDFNQLLTNFLSNNSYEIAFLRTSPL